MPAPSPPPSALPVYHADYLRTAHDVLTDHRDVSVYLAAEVDAREAEIIARHQEGTQLIMDGADEQIATLRSEVARLSRALEEANELQRVTDNAVSALRHETE